jgi:signal transduction histidine kinase/Tfp pilus assembly protein PilF
MKTFLTWIIIISFIPIVFAQNDLDIDPELKKISDPVNKIKFLDSLSRKEYNLEKQQKYIIKGIDLCKRYNNDSLLFALNGLLAENLMFQGKLKAADSLIHSALLQRSKINNKKRLAEALNIQGSILYSLGQYKNASEIFFQALEMVEDVNYKDELIHCYNNLGRVFWKIEEWDKAMGYFRKLNDLSHQTGNDYYRSSSLGNIGLIYRSKQMPDSAIFYYIASLAINKRLKDTFQMAINFQNIGNVYMDKGELKPAREYFNRSNSLSRKANDQIGVMLTYHNIATVDMEEGNLDEAIINLNKALDLAGKLGSYDNLRLIYKDLSGAYEKKGKYAAALINIKKYQELEDSLRHENHLVRINELEIKYQTAEKEKQLATQKALLAKKEGQLILVTSIGILFVVTSLLIFFLLRQRRENRYQTESIKAITEAQEKERQRLARDLHDSVGSMLVSLRNKLIGSQKKKEEIDLLDKVNREIRQLSHDMMPGTLKKFGLETAIKSELEITNQHTGLKTGLSSLGISKKLPDNIEVQIYRVIQETIQNTIKHARASTLNISIFTNNNHLHLMVEDDGIGFIDKKNKEGLGLKNIETRVKLLNGKLNVDSHPQSGTVVNIDIPVS